MAASPGSRAHAGSGAGKAWSVVYLCAALLVAAFAVRYFPAFLHPLSHGGVGALLLLDAAVVAVAVAALRGRRVPAPDRILETLGFSALLAGFALSFLGIYRTFGALGGVVGADLRDADPFLFMARRGADALVPAAAGVLGALLAVLGDHALGAARRTRPSRRLFAFPEKTLLLLLLQPAVFAFSRALWHHNLSSQVFPPWARPIDGAVFYTEPGGVWKAFLDRWAPWPVLVLGIPVLLVALAVAIRLSRGGRRFPGSLGVPDVTRPWVPLVLGLSFLLALLHFGSTRVFRPEHHWTGLEELGSGVAALGWILGYGFLSALIAFVGGELAGLLPARTRAHGAGPPLRILGLATGILVGGAAVLLAFVLARGGLLGGYPDGAPGHRILLPVTRGGIDDVDPPRHRVTIGLDAGGRLLFHTGPGGFTNGGRWADAARAAEAWAPPEEPLAVLFLADRRAPYRRLLEFRDRLPGNRDLRLCVAASEERVPFLSLVPDRWNAEAARAEIPWVQLLLRVARRGDTVLYDLWHRELEEPPAPPRSLLRAETRPGSLETALRRALPENDMSLVVEIGDGVDIGTVVALQGLLRNRLDTRRVFLIGSAR